MDPGHVDASLLLVHLIIWIKKSLADDYIFAALALHFTEESTCFLHQHSSTRLHLLPFFLESIRAWLISTPSPGDNPPTPKRQSTSIGTPTMPAQMAYFGGIASLPTPQEQAHYPTAHHLPASHEAFYPYYFPYPVSRPNQVHVSPAAQVPIQERWHPREIPVWGHPLPGSEGPPVTLLNPGYHNINGDFFFVPYGPNPTTTAHVPSPGGPSIQETRPRARDSPSSMAYISPATHGPNPYLGHTPIEHFRQRDPVVSTNPNCECTHCQRPYYDCPNQGPPTLDASDNDRDTTTVTDKGVSLSTTSNVNVSLTTKGARKSRRKRKGGKK